MPVLYMVGPFAASLIYKLYQPIAIDEKDMDGHTALMWAAYQGELKSIAALIQATQYQSTCYCGMAHPTRHATMPV